MNLHRERLEHALANPDWRLGAGAVLDGRVRLAAERLVRSHDPRIAELIRNATTANVLCLALDAGEALVGYAYGQGALDEDDPRRLLGLAAAAAGARFFARLHGPPSAQKDEERRATGYERAALHLVAAVGRREA